MRADAVRNRERIVDAARELFVESGGEVPLDEVARRAGVGNATVYRHFADRDALVRDVVLAVTERVANRAQRALDALDAPGGGEPFEALRAFVSGAMDERVGALCPALSPRFGSGDAELVRQRERLEALVGELLGRTQRAGAVRADVGVGDLLVVISQLTRPLPGAGCARFERFIARHVQLFLDGLRAPAPSRLPGTPATLEGLRQT
ncbi:TetR/AcrR family transcriptional regulator [Streptomyces sp. TRM 70351]|uniref:TetR/AcrR family transcriptional regulator n=1 Tax=Streptomyces sp. TRM 70351 TaxID=3116552 RepID=UPI002E7BD402|nr:TetR/AcrR family transcriptional regulator [Streptomyces sp. TRM 70351]MEE1929512.1 TetR/AcrR family transcriptional regulator [Streptomyces sp. TRM 70351]